MFSCPNTVTDLQIFSIFEIFRLISGFLKIIWQGGVSANLDLFSIISTKTSFGDSSAKTMKDPGCIDRKQTTMHNAKQRTLNIFVKTFSVRFQLKEKKY